MHPKTAIRALQSDGQVNRMARGSHFYVDQKALKLIYWTGILEAGSA
jgi:predicted RNA binding protein YcfA (HicA-like mRNA interferase family)